MIDDRSSADRRPARSSRAVFALPAPIALIDRRQALRLFGLGGIAALAACGGSTPSPGSAAPATTGTTGTTVTTGTTPATTASTTAAVDASRATPGETGGPFPADGSNSNGSGSKADVLSDRRSLRRDIRADLDGSNVQDGVPFRLSMRVVQKGTGAPLAGSAVYIWHCNRDGVYSVYNSSMNGGDYSARTFLRGVQVADADGRVTFDTILPGRYQGRAFHIHFEVFGDGTYGSKLLTSQMAMDDARIDALYAAAPGYASALRNDTDNARDNVFSDGVDRQLLTVGGDVTSGITASYTAVV